MTSKGDVTLLHLVCFLRYNFRPTWQNNVIILVLFVNTCTPALKARLNSLWCSWYDYTFFLQPLNGNCNILNWAKCFQFNVSKIHEDHKISSSSSRAILRNFLNHIKCWLTCSKSQDLLDYFGITVKGALYARPILWLFVHFSQK